tara:strand:+ start:322 stop:2289 length:1968 start_codon:yes stop_codon:yes gene_type:complete
LFRKLKKVPTLLRRVTSNRKYIHEIDGLRFVAIIPVLFQHLSERIIKYTPIEGGVSWSESNIVSIFGRGTFGVFLFFAISGFILSLPFGKAFFNRSKQPSYKTYLKRRLTRLEPPFIIWMTLFTVVLYIQSRPPVGDILGNYMASIFYCHSLIYNSYSIINPVAWSLEVEFQFYLLAPFLAYGYFSISHERIRRIFITVFIILIPILQHMFGWNAMPWKATIIGQLQHFLLGFLIADFYLNRQILFFRKNYLWDLVGFLSLIFMACTWSNEWHKELIFSFSTGLLFISVFNGMIMNKYFSNPWITAIGGMCYTIYLIHLPLMELVVQWSAPILSTSSIFVSFFFQFIFWIPIVLILSGVFYLLIEKPFMDPSWSSLTKERLSSSFFPFKLLTSIMNKKLLFLAFVLVIGPAKKLKSQDQKDFNLSPSKSVMEVNYENPDITQLMTIDQMVELAIIHSPLLKSKEIQIANYDNELKLNNRKWSDYISVGGTYLYGSSFYTDTTEGSLGINDFRTTNRNNSIANLTLSARIPISELFNRKVRNDKVLNQRRIEEYEKEAIEQTIREVIIKQCNVLKTKIKAIGIKAKEIESLKLTTNYAEQFMRKGDLDINEYTTALSILSRAEYELLNFHSEANLSFLLLQEIIGASPSKIVDTVQ